MKRATRDHFTPCANMFGKILQASIGALLLAVLSTENTEVGLDNALPQDETTILNDGRKRTPIITKAMSDRASQHPGSGDKPDRGKRRRLDHFHSGNVNRKPRHSVGAKGCMISGHLSHGKPGHPRGGKPSRLSYQTKKLRRGTKRIRRRNKKNKHCLKPLKGLKRVRTHGHKPSSSRKRKRPESKVPLLSFLYYYDDDRSTERNKKVVDGGDAKGGNGCVDGRNSPADGGSGRAYREDSDMFYYWDSSRISIW